MIWIILTVLCSVFIFVLFRAIGENRVPLIYPIVINYFVGALLGIVTLSDINGVITEGTPWMAVSVGIGLLFIGNFFIIGWGTKIVGISLSSASVKMSLLMPVLFSIIRYNEPVTEYKLAGILLALGALLFISIKKGEKRSVSRKDWYVIPVLFIGSGCVDTSIKFAQSEFLSGSDFAGFSGFVFLFAGLCGIILTAVLRYKFSGFLNKRALIYGLLLGMFNFGALYFFIKALHSEVFDTSIIFGVNSILILIFTAIVGILFFKERLTKLNLAGIGLAIISIFILTTV
ncbi:MAG: EamA family transporter [Bacteroidales bacterium]|jgi:drug/metabolite transporter (DMT)-like permease|nr:EamA family transporter [Bacteroidales bacterium]